MKLYRSLVVAGALALAGSSHAATYSVMPIGDSLTWGFQSGGGTGGGWRVPLFNQLEASSPGQFGAVGIKGDNNTATVPGEANVSGQNDDWGGGSELAPALHEGYSGWVIDGAPYSTPSYWGTDGVSDSGRRGVLQNTYNSVSNPTGTIQPDNADIVMLMIGINDIVGYTGYNDPYDNATNYPDPIGSMVNSLGVLIDRIAATNPTATLLVSTLLPVSSQQGSASASVVNSAIDDFNSQLLNDYFGSVFFADSLSGGEGVFAEHTSLQNVFLLDAHASLMDGSDPLAAGFFDGLHLSPTGNSLLADFYYDRFVAGAIPVPEPSALLLALMGVTMIAMRRGRRAQGPAIVLDGLGNR